MRQNSQTYCDEIFCIIIVVHLKVKVCDLNPTFENAA